MKELTNPLDKIKIASPCSADWDRMYGDERKRFCSECKLNVYNISEMTKDEAENFILRSEGRLCLRIYQRRDGTVITRDCPVGWQRVKRRVSLVCKAALGLAGGFLAGVFGLGVLREMEALTGNDEPAIVQPSSSFTAARDPRNPLEGVSFGGMVTEDNLNDVGVAILTSRF